MLRTRRTGNGRVLFTLSGRIETTEDIKQLQQLLAVETSGQQVILDLRDVTLVNQDAVKFLRRCEADGIKLENCPLHVRRWIDQVKDRLRRQRI
jgi:anti-anti-sigma regulatory factor